MSGRWPVLHSATLRADTHRIIGKLWSLYRGRFSSAVLSFRRHDHECQSKYRGQNPHPPARPQVTLVERSPGQHPGEKSLFPSLLFVLTACNLQSGSQSLTGEFLSPHCPELADKDRGHALSHRKWHCGRRMNLNQSNPGP
eukprot:3449906-Rhodomonas_salina.4